jgi:thioredoxin 1
MSETTHSAIQHVNDGNFDNEVLTASKGQLVMVDFWAEWCRPCHMLAPTVDQIAKEYQGKLKVVKVNVDESSNAAVRYNIRGIPTLLIFKDGEVADQIVGAVPKEQIQRVLGRLVS